MDDAQHHFLLKDPRCKSKESKKSIAASDLDVYDLVFSVSLYTDGTTIQLKIIKIINLSGKTNSLVLPKQN